MIALKINNGKGYFKNSKDDFQLIEEINKDELLWLIDKAINEDEFIMDSYDENILQNKAHQIIYKHVLEKLNGIIESRVETTLEIENLFKEEIEKFKSYEND